MTAFLLYILKVNICIALFYLVYVIALKRDTFLNGHRLFLMSAIVGAFLLPLATPQLLADGYHSLFQNTTTHAEITFETPQFVVLTEEVTTAKTHSFMDWATCLAIAISGLLLVRFGIQCWSILKIKRSSGRSQFNNSVYYIPPHSTTPFSFFGWIFINPNNHNQTEFEHIFFHELTHAHQWHSLDRLIAEWCCIVFWWNPFVWGLRHEIINNLEYIADRNVLNTGANRQCYQYHLLNLTYPKTAVEIVNQFNVLQLKQRIKMMNKTRTSARGLVKYTFVLPLVACLLTINSVMAQQQNPPQKKTEKTKQVVVEDNDNNSAETQLAPEKMPQFPGGEKAMLLFLQKNIKYPKEAQEKGIQGNVVCSLIITPEGEVSDVTVVRAIDPLLDAEAIRVIESMPKWEPGLVDGKPVPVRYTIPIKFALNTEQSSKKATNNQVPSDEVYNVSDNSPMFIGGEGKMYGFLSQIVKYPKEAQLNNIEGRVICQFVVEKDGSITNAKVVRSVDPLLDAEALRVIQLMPNWKPGTIKGEPVRVRYVMPIIFRLPNEKVNQ